MINDYKIKLNIQNDLIRFMNGFSGKKISER